MQPRLNAMMQAADGLFADLLEQIKEYIAFRAVSAGGASGPTATNVRRLAQRIVADLRSMPANMRPARCEMHELDGALPAIGAVWQAGEDRPTVGLWGHADSQPANPDEWDTPPFEGVVKDGRLYGRGSADDLGGWLAGLLAIKAWLSVEQRLPVNVRLMVETAEEIGSPGLMAHIDGLGRLFGERSDFFAPADALILTDSANPSIETPGLTTSLRGLATVDLVCTAQQGGHSGVYGGVYPDPSIALFNLLGRLVDDNGRAKVGIVDLPAHERQRLANATGVVSKLPNDGRPPAEWALRQTAITVTGTTLPDLNLARAKTSDVEIPRPANEIKRRVAARLSVRIPPGLTTAGVIEEIRSVVTASPPPGIDVRLVPAANDGAMVEPWMDATPTGCVAVEAVDRAFHAGWGRIAERIGIGGSIPFITQFGDRYGGAKPIFLNGVLDPLSALHAPNESLHLEVLRKTVRTGICLLAEFGRLEKGRFLLPRARN